MKEERERECERGKVSERGKKEREEKKKKERGPLCFLINSHPICAKKNPRVALCGSASVSECL